MARRAPSTDRFVAADGEVTLLAPEENARGFRMLAYTGATVKRWYGDLVIDLEGLKVDAQKKPILLQHDDAQRAGFSSAIEKTKRGLEITGTLLDNPTGNDIARDSKQGFPFQASVGVGFDRLEDVAEGHERKCNGRMVKGPITIATQSRLLESSFVTLGADGNTSAEALSRNGAGLSDADSIEIVQAEASMAGEDKAGVEKGMREKLAAIRKALPGRAELAMERFEAGDTPEQAAALGAILDREDGKRKAEVDSLKADLAAAQKTRPVEVVPFNAAGRDAASGPPPKVDFTQLEPAERAKAEFAADPKLRKEFGDVGAYEAFLRHDARGAIKIVEKSAAS